MDGTDDGGTGDTPVGPMGGGERLRESGDIFGEIAALLPEVLWIFTPGFDRAIYISPAYERIWGRRLEDLYAHGREFLEAVHPDDVATLVESMERVREVQVYGVEYRVIRPDGSVRWVYSRGFPVRDADGTVVRIVGTTEDITERRELEAERAAAEARYRRLVEHAPYAIYALDREGRFTELNAAAELQLGRGAEELIGRPISEVIAPEDRHIAQASLRAKQANGGDTADIQVRMLDASGARRLVHVRATAIREDGEFIGTQGIARDITEEVERERQLRRAERLASVGTLVGGVAHELNNPLTSIISFASLLAESARTPEEREDLETIRREGLRAAKIVSDLRVLARQTQQEATEKQRVDLSEIAAHVLRTRRYVHETHNIEVRQDLPAGLPAVLGDRTQLEQVVVNLMVNAEQAMEAVEKRTLIVRTRASRDGVSLAVVDSGTGIPQAHLEKIFDPFFTTKAPSQGTGLGLSLVHGIVREHGGQIHVESAVGNGTAFRVDLPFGDESLARAGSGERSEMAEKETRGLRILLVDDEAAIRNVFTRSLARRGHHVDSAADGREALRLLEREGGDYDLVLSDLRMPGLSGDRFLEELRRIGTGLERRLVFMTGDAVSAGAARLLEESGMPVIYKPVTPSDLTKRVEELAAEFESA